MGRAEGAGLTPRGPSGHLPVVAESVPHDPRKKHRHDVGLPDHGPVTTESLTRAIQGLLILLLAASAALTVYALVVATT